MRTPLAAALGLAGLLAAAPLAGGEGPAYSSLVGLAAASDEDRAEEGRLPDDEGALRDAVASPRPAVTAERRSLPAWTRLFVLLLPPASTGVPELKASTAAFAGPRPIRPSVPVEVPRPAEEGARRGMADMLALLSAGADPAGPGR